MNRHFGLDTASVDANKPPDYVAAKAAGNEFIYLRKSHCWFDTSHSAWRLAVDPFYARDAQHARDAGLVVGAYMFVSYHRDAPSFREQVGNFIAAPGEIKKGIDLPPALDLEFTGKGIQDTKQGQIKVAELILDYVDELETKFGCYPAIYTSHVQTHDSNGLGGALTKVIDPHTPIQECPLWQKVPYRLSAGNKPDMVPYYQPHADADKNDPHDYRRIPEPWASTGYTPWIIQGQGDAVGVAGHTGTADIDVFLPARPGSVDTAKLRWAILRASRHVDDRVVPGAQVVADYQTAMISRFQQARGLHVTGEVDVQTFAALAWL